MASGVDGSWPQPCKGLRPRGLRRGEALAVMDSWSRESPSFSAQTELTFAIIRNPSPIRRGGMATIPAASAVGIKIVVR